MKQPFIVGFSLATAMWLLVTIVLIWEAEELTMQSMREEAIRAGHAEYYLDASNQRQWRWKPNEQH